MPDELPQTPTAEQIALERLRVARLAAPSPADAGRAYEVSRVTGEPYRGVADLPPAEMEPEEWQTQYLRNPEVARFIASRSEAGEVMRNDLANLNGVMVVQRANQESLAQAQKEAAQARFGLPTWDELTGHFRLGEIQAAMAEMGYAEASEGTPIDQAKLDQLTAEQTDLQEQLGTRVDFFGRAVSTTAEQGQNLLGTIESALKWAGIMGATGGVLGAAGGPLAPASVPAGITLGIESGALFGAFKYAMEQEAGSAYLEIRDLRDENGRPIDRDLASAVSLTIGVINGLGETVADVATARLFRAAKASGAGALGRRLLGAPTLRGAMLKFFADYTAAVGTEGSTEAAQELVTAYGVELAAALSDQEFDPEQFGTLRDKLARAFEAGEAGAMVAGVLGGAGGVVRAPQAVHEVRVARRSLDALNALGRAFDNTETRANAPTMGEEFVRTAVLKQANTARLPIEAVETLRADPEGQAILSAVGVTDLVVETARIDGDSEVQVDLAKAIVRLDEAQRTKFNALLRLGELPISAEEATQLEQSGELDAVIEEDAQDRAIRAQVVRIVSEAAQATKGLPNVQVRETVNKFGTLLSAFAHTLQAQGVDPVPLLDGLSVGTVEQAVADVQRMAAETLAPQDVYLNEGAYIDADGRVQGGFSLDPIEGVAPTPVIRDGRGFRAAPPAVVDAARREQPSGDGQLRMAQRLGARVPAGTGAVETALDETLQIGLQELRRAPATMESHAGHFETVTGMPARLKGESAADYLERVITQIGNNLLALHDAMPEELRNRARLWYDGANKLMQTWAAEYGLPERVVAGVLAVLSPQKDWYQNVDLARRVLDVCTNEANQTITDEQFATGIESLKSSARASFDTSRGKILPRLKAQWKAEQKANKTRRVWTKRVAAEQLALELQRRLSNIDELFAFAKEKPWADMDYLERGRFIRLRDMGTNPQSYQLINPEGEFIGVKTSAKGEPSAVGWADYPNLAKAAMMVAEQSIETVSDGIGNQHKVRNFYNNIYDPNSPYQPVTIDTHAVAAALLRALSGQAMEVEANLGGGGKNTGVGISGTYPVYAEAYRRAAAARGLQAREMQSITWEAVRGLFRPTFKSKGANVAAIDAIWSRFDEGSITYAEALEAVGTLAGGIEVPDWARPDSGASAEDAHTGDAEELSARRWALRAVDPGAGKGLTPRATGLRVSDFAGVAARDFLLQPGWTILTATREVADDVANAAANDALEAELAQRGIEFAPLLEGAYAGVDQGRNYLIIADSETALDLGRRYGQESVLTSEGLLYSDGSIQERKSSRKTPGGVVVGEAATEREYFSVLPDGTAFSFDLKSKPKARKLNQRKPGGAPRSVHEAVLSGKPFKLVHWSNTAGLTTIDPKFAGTAGAGTERQAYAAGAERRVYLGLSGRYRKEAVVPGVAAYEVEVNPSEVYDFNGDPEGFFLAAFKRHKSGVKALKSAHRAAAAAGYRFFYNSAGGPYEPVLYTVGKVDVKQVSEARKAELLATAPIQATEAERKAYATDTPARVLKQTAPNAPIRGSIEFDGTKAFIAVAKGADASTLVHELWHYFGQTIQGLVASGAASEQMAADWASVGTWATSNRGQMVAFLQDESAADDGTGYSQDVYDAAMAFIETASDEDLARAATSFGESLDGDVGAVVGIAVHELIARGGEAYLREGVTPSGKLARVFAAFAKWLTRIYEQVTALNVQLDPAITGVFDRWLASEQDIKAAQEVQRLTADGLRGLEGLNLTAAEKAGMEAELDRAQDEAYARLVADRAREEKRNRSAWRKQAGQEFDETPLGKVFGILRATGGLRRAAIANEYGEDTALALSKMGFLASRDATGGAITEDTALAAGYDSADAMIIDLLDTPYRSRRQAVEARVQELAAAADSQVTADDAIAKTEGYRNYLHSLREYLRRATGKETGASRGAIAARAAKQLSQMVLSDATAVRRFLLAAKSAIAAERRAHLAGDYETAVAKADEAVLQIEKAKLAAEIKEKVAREVDSIRAMANAKRGVIDEDYHYGAVQLAERYGMFNRGHPSPKWLDKYKADNANSLPTTEALLRGISEDVDMAAMFPRNLVAGAAMPYRSMTVAVFEDAVNMIDALAHYGRVLRDQTIMNGTAKVREVADASVEWMGKINDRTPWFDADTSLGKMVSNIRKGLVAPLTQIPFVLRMADGFNGGRVKNLDIHRPLTKHLYLRAAACERDAQNLITSTMDQMRGALATLHGAMKRLPKKPQTAVALPQDYATRLGQTSLRREQILSIILNLGNQDNARKLAEGLGLVDDEGKGNPASLFLLAKMFTEKELLAVQQVWDTLESLWPATAETFKNIYGFRPPKVAADEFTVRSADGKDVVLRGGYFPIAFDPRLSEGQAALDEAAAVKNAFEAQFARPSVQKGHTIQRAETAGGKPILLDAQAVLAKHFDYAIRFITHGEFIRDASRLINDKAFSKTFADKFGQEVYGELNKWLRGQARQEAETLTLFDKVVEHWRPLTSLYVLGLKVKSIINQADALFTLPADIGIENYARGLAKLSNPEELVRSWKTMLELSPFMRERLYGGRDREMHDLLRGLQFKIAGKVQEIKTVAQAVSLAPITLPSLGFEFFAWTAMYEKHLAAGLPVEQASLLADEAIASTQPATRPMDFASMQRSRKGAHRLITLLMTFSIHRMNANLFFIRAAKAGTMSWTDAAVYSFLTFVAAPAATALLPFAVWGDDLPEEERPSLVGTAGFEMLLYQIQGIPLGRDILEKSVDLATEGKTTSKFRTSLDTPFRLHAEAAMGLTALVRGIGGDIEGEEAGDAALALADLVSFYSGVPVVRAYKDVREGIRQADELDAGAGNILIPNPELRRR